ncbi:TPA: FAD-binding oxidoreductase, partial [Acinetobacter baumannii]|nr:FAD-binding oxidoreductase [Acinetobacter baumannii]
QFNVAITPSGGRTGLSAGAVATNGEIVISMDKMNQILEFFPADRMVRVQAGVVTEQLQNYAEEQGMYYPVDFASAGSSQIGGNIGTNAGGIKVIKYGMTRNWVLGL